MTKSPQNEFENAVLDLATAIDGLAIEQALCMARVRKAMADLQEGRGGYPAPRSECLVVDDGAGTRGAGKNADVYAEVNPYPKGRWG